MIWLDFDLLVRTIVQSKWNSDNADIYSPEVRNIYRHSQVEIKGRVVKGHFICQSHEYGHSILIPFSIIRILRMDITGPELDTRGNCSSRNSISSKYGINPNPTGVKIHLSFFM